jgi:hypothetical protein
MLCTRGKGLRWDLPITVVKKRVPSGGGTLILSTTGRGTPCGRWYRWGLNLIIFFYYTLKCKVRVKREEKKRGERQREEVVIEDDEVGPEWLEG